MTQEADWFTSPMGAGNVTRAGDQFRLTLPATDNGSYHNAQIDSYGPSLSMNLRPPLRITIRARAEGELCGTAGFGLWNQPFARSTRRLRLPKAAWFFYGSPPNNMPLALNVPGWGWKAATFDATRAAFLTLLPAAPPGFLLMRLPALYRRLWPIGQRAIGVSEYWLGESIPVITHEYTLTWLPDQVVFAIDGTHIHSSPFSPRGPLGFVAWVDNQYAVVTPQGKFRFGLVDVPQPQALELESVHIAQTV